MENKNIVDVVCEAVGRAFAACKLKYDEANKRAIAAQNAASEQIRISNMCANYDVVAELVAKAICNANNAIMPVTDYECIMCNTPVWHFYSGVYAWIFRAKLKPGNAYPAHYVQRTLQDELNQLAWRYNQPPFRVTVQFRADNSVYIAVAYECDVSACQKIHM